MPNENYIIKEFRYHLLLCIIKKVQLSTIAVPYLGCVGEQIITFLKWCNYAVILHFLYSYLQFAITIWTIALCALYKREMINYQ